MSYGDFLGSCLRRAIRFAGSLLAASLLSVFPTIGLANPARDAAFLAAFDAYRAGDPVKLARHATAVKGSVLDPYLEYWRLSLRLEDQPESDIAVFLSSQSGSYVTERLRGEWLKILGKRRDWARFESELGPLVREDAEIRCYGWLARHARGDGQALEDGLLAWREPREFPPGCQVLVEAQLARGLGGVGAIWDRARLLFEANQITAAKTTLGLLPKGERPDEAALAQAARQPGEVISRLPKQFASRAAREVAVLAFTRQVAIEPRAVARQLESAPAGLFGDAERRYLWSRVGMEAARQHAPEALEWFSRAGEAPVGDEALAWQTRAALRAGHWTIVRDAIDRMSVEARADPAWSYWYGRAAAALGKGDTARAYFQRIASQPDFYGLLAAEELGFTSTIPAAVHQPPEEEVKLVREVPGLARALELYRLGLRSEANREWIFTIRTFDDRQLLAASEVARRAEIFDRAINTADRTTALHNFGLRYLAPFREVFSAFAKQHGLEESWVFGLVRQESRFIVDAKSVAGAQGLMQLMPRTASWVAQKIGFREYSPQRVTDVKTNVTLGTGYLKMVLDDLGHPVLASAAYNAGPGRARRWRDAKPLEGAVYAESIPFNETRDYVKKVMANAVLYAAVLGGKSVPLKSRLGTIPGRSSADRFNEDLP